MASTFTSLLFLACISSASSQLVVNGNVRKSCQSQNPSVISTYLPSQSKCCDIKWGDPLLAVCCVDTTANGVCKCNPNLARTAFCAVTSPTSPSPTHYCPPSKPSSRFLNSSPVRGNCIGRGTVAFKTATGLICNAALVKNLLLTLTSCAGSVQAALAEGHSISLMVGSTAVPLDKCALQNSKIDGAMTFWILPATTSFILDKVLEKCPMNSCPYASDVMGTAIVLSSCFAQSYGLATIGSGGPTSTTPLNEVPLRLTSPTACSSTSHGSETQCFESPSKGVACLADKGAPVFCSLKTGEIVLYGLTSVSTCNPSSSMFTVVPISSTVTTTSVSEKPLN